MKSSLHRLIPFLPLFCSCQFRKLDSVEFLCSQAHIPADWRLQTQLNSSQSQSQSQSYIATDGRSLSKSWCRAPSGAHDQVFIIVWQLRSCFCGAPHLTICCWPSPAQSFSSPSPLNLATIFYCLSFETSLFVASYDSQGHGGGIRPRLHTGEFFSNEPLFFITTLHGPHRKHSLSAVRKACLQHRCVVMEVTRLLLAYSLQRECVYRFVA
jgi:hypothetical protein